MQLLEVNAQLISFSGRPHRGASPVSLDKETEAIQFTQFHQNWTNRVFTSEFVVNEKHGSIMICVNASRSDSLLARCI